MKNVKSVKVMYGNGLKHKIADFMHRHGLIRILYEIPIVGSEGTVGYVYTMKGNPVALWLMTKMFDTHEEYLTYTIREERRFDTV